MARCPSRRTTAPSSPWSSPTRRSPPASGRETSARIRSSSPGGTLQAQPPPAAYWVSRGVVEVVTRSVCPGGLTLTQALPLGHDDVLRIARGRDARLEHTEPGEYRCGHASSAGEHR